MNRLDKSQERLMLRIASLKMREKKIEEEIKKIKSKSLQIQKESNSAEGVSNRNKKILDTLKERENKLSFEIKKTNKDRAVEEKKVPGSLRRILDQYKKNVNKNASVGTFEAHNKLGFAKKIDATKNILEGVNQAVVYAGIMKAVLIPPTDNKQAIDLTKRLTDLTPGIEALGEAHVNKYKEDIDKLSKNKKNSPEKSLELDQLISEYKKDIKKSVVKEKDLSTAIRESNIKLLKKHNNESKESDKQNDFSDKSNEEIMTYTKKHIEKKFGSIGVNVFNEEMKKEIEKRNAPEHNHLIQRNKTKDRSY
ncbi:hypothetical protein [Xanthocytophaga flava]|uniref:hypothetical protein n=1 Tax=Xanthocytophaga flava TaxID=3048013 RepID=UPI0028D10C22|nr:hypothetical protein [Xanthocytophaga flavus]MDJ1470340.1 hypothetical protein [Xanthocytophaga flavus]